MRGGVLGASELHLGDVRIVWGIVDCHRCMSSSGVARVLAVVWAFLRLQEAWGMPQSGGEELGPPDALRKNRRSWGSCRLPVG